MPTGIYLLCILFVKFTRHMSRVREQAHVEYDQ